MPKQIDELKSRPMKVMVNGVLIKKYNNITPFNYWHNDIFFLKKCGI